MIKYQKREREREREREGWSDGNLDRQIEIYCEVFLDFVLVFAFLQRFCLFALQFVEVFPCMIYRYKDMKIGRDK